MCLHLFEKVKERNQNHRCLTHHHPGVGLLANTFTEKGTFLPYFHGYQFGPGPDPKPFYLASSNLDQITIKINNTTVTLGYNN